MKNCNRIFEFDPDTNNFASACFSSDVEAMTEIYYSDISLLDTWIPLRCMIYDSPKKSGDFFSVSNYRKLPLCTEKSWQVIKPLLGDDGEGLPIIHPDGSIIYMIHIIQPTDAIDLEQSQLLRSKIGDKRVMRIDHHVFINRFIKNKHIFRLPVVSGGGLFVDTTFRQAVEKHQLSGLIFKDLSQDIMD